MYRGASGKWRNRLLALGKSNTVSPFGLAFRKENAVAAPDDVQVFDLGIGLADDLDEPGIKAAVDIANQA